VFRWLAAHSLFSITCDVLSVIQVLFFGANNNLGGTLYSIGAVSFFSLIFYHAIGNVHLKRYLYLINIVYVVLVTYNAIYVQGSSINSYSFLSSSILVLAFCVVYYFKLLRDLPTENLYQLPLFWIVSGFFFTKSGKIVLYTVIQYLMDHHQDNLMYLWIMHNSLTIIENSMLVYGAWLQLKIIHRAPQSMSR
jgi:hypothetical protein